MARPEKQGRSTIAENRRGSFVAVAERLLQALADRRDEEAWEAAKALAHAVVDDPAVDLAKTVLEGGPFAMRKAGELAELTLAAHVQDRRRADRDLPRFDP